MQKPKTNSPMTKPDAHIQQKGVFASEYALMITVVAIIVLIAFTWMGFQLFDLFTHVNEAVPPVES